MRRNASRKAGLEVSVSARALNIREPTFAAVRPVGDQAPAIRGDAAPLLALDDDERLVGRGDVEARPGIVGERLGREDLGQLRGRALLAEASAHSGKSSGGSCIVGRDGSARPDTHPPDRPQRSRARSIARRRGRLLDQGAALIEGGDYGVRPSHLPTRGRLRRPGGHRRRACSGSAQARYRMDDEDAAVRTWEAILELPETTSTYHAWRNVAAARVREGDLNGAIAAYREADRRAPAADKPEIANRLGWLAKETGNVRASRRYFARGRGSVLPSRRTRSSG